VKKDFHSPHFSEREEYCIHEIFQVNVLARQRLEKFLEGMYNLQQHLVGVVYPTTSTVRLVQVRICSSSSNTTHCRPYNIWLGHIGCRTIVVQPTRQHVGMYLAKRFSTKIFARFGY
jgi:hypothetical protein